MSINKIGLISLALTVVISSCSPTTKLTGTLKTGEVPTPKSYKKVGVVVISPIVSNRAIVEQDLALTFNSRGVKSSPTYDIFPFVASPEVVTKAYEDPEELHAFVRERVTRNKFDALLIIGVYDVHQEERYSGGMSVGVGVAAPTYYGYYSYAYSTVYSTGYYELTSTYFIEFNLFDVESEGLVWMGTSEVKDPEYIQDESKIFSNLIVNAVFKDEVLLPSK